MAVSTKEKLRKLALAQGFDDAGFATPKVPGEVLSKYKAWIQSGKHGTMEYLARSIETRSDLNAILGGVQSVIVLVANYYQGEAEQIPGGMGRVARYAWGKNYHNVLKKRLKRLEKAFAGICQVSPKEFRHTLDTKPIFERGFAVKAGLGHIGDNTCFYSRKSGSFCFLATILTTVKIEPDTENALAKETEPCGTCTACLDHCPTTALVHPGVLDASRCISYLTIEHKGKIEDGLANKMGNQVFGCDTCQDVCPKNKDLPLSGIKDFYPDRGAGRFLDPEKILAIESEETFHEQFNGTPLLRAKLEGLQRNAKLVQ